jgi:hypothetical protein
MEQHDKAPEEGTNKKPNQQKVKKGQEPIRLEDLTPSIMEKTGLPEHLVSRVLKDFEKVLMATLISGRHSIDIDGVGTINLHKVNSGRRKRKKRD